MAALKIQLDRHRLASMYAELCYAHNEVERTRGDGTAADLVTLAHRGAEQYRRGVLRMFATVLLGYADVREMTLTIEDLLTLVTEGKSAAEAVPQIVKMYGR